jgi:uncharacterized membrane protein
LSGGSAKKARRRKKQEERNRRRKKVISISYRFYMSVPCIYLKALPVVLLAGFFHFFSVFFGKPLSFVERDKNDPVKRIRLCKSEKS